MRITNKMITTKYISSVNNLSSDLYKLNAQVSSGRSFSKASENTSAAIRAFQIRKDMSSTEGYNANIQHAQSTLINSESSISHIQELVQTAQIKILQGQNGTQSADERKIIATELRNIQEQLLQTLNASSSGSYYFGGSNTDIKPFEVVGGKLQYNLVALDQPNPFGTPVDNVNMIKALESDSRFIDIGLNVKFDLSGAIDKNTVFSYSIPGIKIVGSGTTDIGLKTSAGLPENTSNNLYDLIGEIATNFESINYDGDKSGKLLGLLQKNSTSVIHTLTEVGAKTSYLDFMTNRLESKTLNDQERQMAIEGVDPMKTIIEFKSQEAAYNAALQMGTKLIQPSIFDFMR